MEDALYQKDHVGTEMMVLGLLAEGSGGGLALQSLGVRLDEATGFFAQ